jgi:putative component of membrane protein insertase Oxa1/YidC/SpoIIIJ protein YidD
MSLTLAVDAAIGKLAITTIGGYQRYLSPHKGFACAYRVLHGGASCSEHVKQVIAAEGLLAGLRSLRSRLKDCRVAARTIKEGRSRRALALEAGRVFDDEFDLVPEKPDARPHPGASSGDGCRLIDAAECLQCCDAPDLSGCDVGAMDCGGVDIPGVDCGGCG